MVYLSSTTTKTLKSVSPSSGTRRSSTDEKYEKHRKQKNMEKYKFVLSIILVTLSVLALWHFGGATKVEAQKRVRSSLHGKQLRHNDHPERAHKLPKGENPDGVLFDHSREMPPHNNNNELGDFPPSENRIEVDKEVQDKKSDDKKLDDNMARKIEELKQFQKKVHERADEFQNDIQEEIKKESQGA